MCGRFALGLPRDEIQQLHGYNVQVGEWMDQDQFVPRYNIAPRSQAPVIRRQNDEDSSFSGTSSGQTGLSSRLAMEDISQEKTGSVYAQGRSEQLASESMSVLMQTMRWGLVPHWSKYEDRSLKTINARCEALIEGPGGMWASIKGRKRCAVVCQGYYEWLKKGKERMPHFTKPAEDRLMLLAGLWDCVTLEGSSQPLWTFTIVTTDANKEFSWLHDRQPVILPDEHALSVWLDTSPGKWTSDLSKLCAPYSCAKHPLLCYQVPKQVGKIGTESPTFVQPISERKDGIAAMFAKQLETNKRKGSPIEKERQEVKRAKLVDTWQDDLDIGQSPTNEPSTSTTKHSHTKPEIEQQSKISNMDGELIMNSSLILQPPMTKGKITSFFAKK